MRKIIILFILSFYSSFLLASDFDIKPNANLTPIKGAFYPIYNSGPNQWLPPTEDIPFDQVNMIFIAFAHVYDIGGKMILYYQNARDGKEPESGDNDHDRIKKLLAVSQAKSQPLCTASAELYDNSMNAFSCS